MLVNAVYYRASHRHLWGMVGLIDCDTNRDPDLEVEDLREIAEEFARKDDQNKGAYQIALMSGVEEDAAWCFNLARSLPGWKTLR